MVALAIHYSLHHTTIEQEGIVTIKIEGEVTVSYTYPITLINGRLVHDEWSAALFAAGYTIVPNHQKSGVEVATLTDGGAFGIVT